MLVPHLAVRNAAEAAEFYKKAFGFEIMCLHKLPDGRVMHGALKFQGGYMLFLCDEFPEHGGQSPQSLGGTPITLHLHVADCDAVFNQAVESGCTAVMPLEEMFWGDRYGVVSDPYGQKWSIATTVRDVSPDQLQGIISAMGEGDMNCPG